MFVVVGATGNTGSAVVETLLNRKQPVRIIVRSADKGSSLKAKGAEVAVASLDDVSALTRAFEGAEGMYLLVPPNYGASAWLADQRSRLDRAADAVKKSGVGHVVFLSSIGGHLTGATGPIRALHYGEQALGGAAKNLTVLRPAYFMENWAPVLGAAKENGVLPTFIAPSTKIPMIATSDIGRIAADQLIAGGQGRKVLELSGPDDYSPNDVAAALGKILKRAVTVQHAPLSAVVPTFKSFGFSDDIARLFEEMYAAIERGALVHEKQGARHVRGQVTLTGVLAQLV